MNPVLPVGPSEGAVGPDSSAEIPTAEGVAEFLRLFKTLMIVGSSFLCDKKCKYCTAAITEWPVVPDNWEKFEGILQELRAKGVRFEYLTFSGNGEPSMQPMEVLELWRKLATEYRDLFEYLRFQTGGNIFFHPEKLDLFKDDFVFEITRVHHDFEDDRKVVGGRDYANTEGFKQSSVIFNMVLLKEREGQIIEDIHEYLRRYPNMRALNLKILNVNTKDSKAVENPGSQWILNNGLQPSDAERVVALMDANFERAKDYDAMLDRYEWTASDGRPITLYARKIKYGKPNLVVYGGETTDYELNKVKVEDFVATNVAAANSGQLK